MNILAKEPGEKYMVLLTDGDTLPPKQGWDHYTRQASSLGVNWTSIAVGTDADQGLMRQLAMAAGGQYFYCGTGSRIPKVFISQARQVARQGLEKRSPFVPQAGRDFDLVKGLSINEFPELADALDATLKSDAQSMLVGRDGMPLLARRRFGLGNVTAFTSTTKNDWAPAWVSWPKNPTFWCQLIQQCMGPPADLYAKSTVYEKGGDVMVILDILDTKGTPVSDLSCDVTFAQSNGPHNSGEHDVRSPRGGLYEIRLTPGAEQGIATIGLHNGTHEVRYSTTLQRTVSNESLQGPDEGSLKAIAESGRGVYARQAAPIAEACIMPPAVSHEQRLSLIAALASLVVAIWIADVAIRRLSGG